MTPTIQNAIKMIPTKQLEATTITMTISLSCSLLVSNCDFVQLDCSGDDIDNGHEGEDIVEKV